jgi:cytochrome c-type biogenesis protein CcmH/NrfF
VRQQLAFMPATGYTDGSQHKEATMATEEMGQAMTTKNGENVVMKERRGLTTLLVWVALVVAVIIGWVFH